MYKKCVCTMCTIVIYVHMDSILKLSGICARSSRLDRAMVHMAWEFRLGRCPKRCSPRFLDGFRSKISKTYQKMISIPFKCGTIGWCPTKMAATAIFLLKAWDIALVDVIGRFLRICDPLLQVPTLCFASSVESNAILAHLS